MLDERRVTVVSHGPSCLDGTTCAVVAARYFAGRRFEPVFANNRDIDEILLGYDPTHPDEEELWITDISWREPATSVHLDALVADGLKLYWIDHHKSAIDRRKEGHLNVAFTDFVLEDRYAASRLLYEYLCKRAEDGGESHPGLLALHNLVMLADDVDRWVLRIEGSREMALAVRAMRQSEAYRTLLSMDSRLTPTPAIERALERVTAELAESLDLAVATRQVAPVPDADLVIVAAECDDYAGEIADRWKDDYDCAVFALYDHRGDCISFRRTPGCSVDLSRLAARFGGGGHPAAAGCNMTTTGNDRSAQITRRIVEAISQEATS